MRIRVIVLACLLALPATAGVAAETYMCYRTSDSGRGVYTQDPSQSVVLSVDPGAVRPRIHIRDASKDLTFSTCKTVTADGSNFSRWFTTECRNLTSIDGSPYTIEPFLAGAYAGISPAIDQGYALYEALTVISRTSGLPFPDRIVVMYADRKPLYEFFCYREKTKP